MGDFLFLRSLSTADLSISVCELPDRGACVGAIAEPRDDTVTTLST